MVEHIVSLQGCISSLLAAKDQVDPLVQVGRDVVAFKGLSMSTHKLSGVSPGPGGQLDGVEAGTILLGPWIRWRQAA